MESNAVKVKFFHKDGQKVTRGLQERKYQFTLPKSIRDRQELKEGSVIAVINRFGYMEPAVITDFMVCKRTYDLKQVVGNYHADYYGELEDGDEK